MLPGGPKKAKRARRNSPIERHSRQQGAAPTDALSGGEQRLLRVFRARLLRAKMSEIENREKEREDQTGTAFRTNLASNRTTAGKGTTLFVCLFSSFFFLFPIDLLCFFTPSLLYSVRGQNEDVAAASAKLHYLFYFHHPRKTRNCGVVFVEKPRFTRFGAVVGGEGGGHTK